MSRVLIFRERLLPASETFIVSQASHLRKHEVQFAGLYPLAQSLQLPTDPISLCSSADRFALLRASIYKRWGLAGRFHQAIAAWNPCLLHAHFAPDGVTALNIVKQIKIPLLVTLHGYDVSVARNFDKEYAKLWEGATLFICVSEFIRRRALAIGFPEHKLRTHYIGIDRGQFCRRGNAGNNSQILFVGRLVEKKGCESLLTAMEIVQKHIPDASLRIVGDGPLRSRLEKKAKDLDLRCTFLGRLRSIDIRRELTEATVFCLPSVTAENGDTEGLPIAILEALAIGVPVVSTLHAGIPEIISHGLNGLLAPEHNSLKLAEYLLLCLSDNSLRETLIDNGIKSVESRFDVQSQTVLLESLYSDVSR